MEVAAESQLLEQFLGAFESKKMVTPAAGGPLVVDPVVEVRDGLLVVRSATWRFDVARIKHEVVWSRGIGCFGAGVCGLSVSARMRKQGAA